MKKKYIATGIVCGTFLSAAALIHKHQATTVQPVEAYTQRTVPGVRGAKPITKTTLIVVWKSNEFPESAFWRGDAGWENCNIEKATRNKMPPNPKFKTAQQDFIAQRVTLDQIKKGDTLLLLPMPGGKFPIPKEFPDTSVNTLFYKTPNSNWMHIRFPKVDKKADILMP
jgi:hypothetical protein